MQSGKIIIIEEFNHEEHSVSYDVKKSLESKGYSICDIVTQNNFAIEKIITTKPDIAIFNLSSTSCDDSFELANKIKNDYNTQVIFLSPEINKNLLEKSINLDPVAFLSHPYNTHELHSAVEKGLHKLHIEKKVKENRNSLSTILYSLQDAVITVDESLNILFINNVACKLLDISIKLENGGNIIQYMSLFDVNTDKPIELNTIISNSSSLNHECEIREALLICYNKKKYPIEYTISELKEESGNFAGFVIVLRDLSERNKIREERLELEKKLFQAQKMEAIGLLAGGIAHDFNNLLTAIVGNLNLIKVRCDNSLHERIKVTENACTRASELVKKLLSFSKSSSEISSEVSIIPIIDEVLSISTNGLEDNITFTMDVQESIPLLRAESYEIYQIIFNLILNSKEAIIKRQSSRKKSFKPEIKISCYEYKNENLINKNEEENLKSSIVFSIKDNGIGMTEEVKSRIFEPFYTLKEIGKGTGLGLSVVYGLVKKYKGEIEVLSQKNEGTEIKITLPCIYNNLQIFKKITDIPAIAEERKSIILIDKEPLILDITSSMLRSLSYNVFTAKNFTEAINLQNIDWSKIDCSIVDLEFFNENINFFPKFYELLNPNIKVILGKTSELNLQEINLQELSIQELNLQKDLSTFPNIKLKTTTKPYKASDFKFLLTD